MKKILTSFIFLYFSFILNAQPFSTQSQWEVYFKNNLKSLSLIEGIWSNSRTIKLYRNYNYLADTFYDADLEKVAIYRQGNSYKAYRINSDNSKIAWTFQKTAMNNVFLFETYFKESNTTAKANSVLTGTGILDFSYDMPEAQIKKGWGELYEIGLKQTFICQLIKIYPLQSDIPVSNSVSGTGIAITSNGIIVTNHHVIENANSIKVKGVNSDFNKTYKAKVLVSDKNNDLALIQIDDYNFISTGNVPFTIKSNLAGVGENIFVLGYPLRASMGDEIKLTNGIISSKTGFQGDISSYQISAPVQPGNSGGPLFDNQGNLIGIINAKHGGAENASYAVKSSYLTNLLELLPSPPKLNSTNLLAGKSLTQQVELAKKFVYIIETE